MPLCYGRECGTVYSNTYCKAQKSHMVCKTCASYFTMEYLGNIGTISRLTSDTTPNGSCGEASHDLPDNESDTKTRVPTDDSSNEWYDAEDQMRTGREDCSEEEMCGQNCKKTPSTIPVDVTESNIQTCTGSKECIEKETCQTCCEGCKIAPSTTIFVGIAEPGNNSSDLNGSIVVDAESDNCIAKSNTYIPGMQTKHSVDSIDPFNNCDNYKPPGNGTRHQSISLDNDTCGKSIPPDKRHCSLSAPFDDICFDQDIPPDINNCLLPIPSGNSFIHRMSSKKGNCFESISSDNIFGSRHPCSDCNPLCPCGCCCEPYNQCSCYGQCNGAHCCGAFTSDYCSCSNKYCYKVGPRGIDGPCLSCFQARLPYCPILPGCILTGPSGPCIPMSCCPMI